MNQLFGLQHRSRTVPVIPYSFSANDYSTAMSSLPIL